jgi:signal transduction histidine kinase
MQTIKKTHILYLKNKLSNGLMLNGSIKQKLVIIIMSVAIFAVGVTTTTISLIGAINLKETLLNEVALVANIVGERNKYLLELGHQSQVSKNMEMFKIRPSVKIACIFDKNNAVFALYPIPSSEASSNNVLSSDAGFKAASACPLLNQPLSRINSNNVEVFQPIKDNDKIAGWIYVMADFREVNSYIKQQFFTAILVIIVVFILSYLLTLRLQKTISEPILELAKAASQVSSQKEYALHIINHKTSELLEDKYAKEIAILIRTINKMLSDIQKHEEQLHKNYRELKKAKEQVESASIAKSQFLATISHELRTPLNAIIGFSTIITSKLFGEINDKYLEYATDIHDSGVHLLEIINDILDLSKAEAGKLSIQLAAFSVTEAVEKAVRLVQERAHKSNVKLSVNIQDSLPYLMGDRVRYMQILLNLLSNAIKFTDSGGSVSVEVNCKNGESGQKLFHTIVSDTGIGMSAEEIKTAFQSFGQIDTGLDRKYEGTGLGLPLTKKLVELHGGSIHIDSKPKFGTVVHVIIPSNHVENIIVI